MQDQLKLWSFPHALLLGRDAISRGNGVIDYVSGTMNWYNCQYTLEPYSDAGPCGTIHTFPSSGDESVDDVMAKYADVFDYDGTQLGECESIPFEIYVMDSWPIRQRPYRAPLHKRKIIEDQITEMLKDDVIQLSTSPWASPVTLVSKRDKSYCFCAHFRKLNSVTTKDSYPLPLIQDIFDQLHGATNFPTLDLKSGY